MKSAVQANRLEPRNATGPLGAWGATTGAPASLAAARERRPRQARKPSPADKALAEAEVPPDRVLRTGLEFWASKTLLTAVELGLFTELARGPLGAEELRQKLGLHPFSALQLFDALVSLRYLDRDNGLYWNSPDTDLLLDRNQPGPMTGIRLPVARAIARRFAWQGYETFVDVGGAQGAVPAQLALVHPHLRGINFDLPEVASDCDEYLSRSGVDARVKFQPGNIFKDPLPRADVVIIGCISHHWDLEQKMTLIKKAYDALPRGGALLVYEALIDGDWGENAFGWLIRLNLLAETPAGFGHDGAVCQGWMRDIGFRQTKFEHLAGPASMVVGIK